MLTVIIVGLVLVALVGVLLYVHDIQLKVLVAQVNRLHGMTAHYGRKVDEQGALLRRFEEELTVLRAITAPKPKLKKSKKS